MLNGDMVVMGKRLDETNLGDFKSFNTFGVWLNELQTAIMNRFATDFNQTSIEKACGTRYKDALDKHWFHLLNESV
jgi:hypothetical protein